MSAAEPKPWFPFGGQYVPVAKAPEVPVSDWEQDIRQLRELGFTAFRSFVAWDRIEPEEGRRDYSALDTAFDLAAKHEVKILLSVGGVFANLVGIYPPHWLWRDRGCQQPIADAARPADAPRPSGPRQYVCLDDPVYRELAGEFLAEVIARYAGHPALAAWVVWNEPENKPCFCPHTQARFRDWLRVKYPDIAALNEAWSLEFPVRFRGFDEVTAPGGVGFLHGGYQPWLDWQTCLQDTMAGAMGWIAELIRQHDPHGHPTTTNLTPGELTGSAVAKGLDIWKIGDVLDVPGMSAYTLWDTRDVDPAETAVRFARLRATSHAPGRPWWIVETEAGPVYWVHGLTPRFTRTPDRILRYWQAVAHGAKAVFAWMYRSRIANAQACEFGLLAWDGAKTERAEATGEVSRVLNRHADLFVPRYPHAEVAILAGHRTDLLYRAETFEASPATFRDYWRRSWAGAYRMCWRRRIPADFVDDRQVSAAGLAGYKVLIVPFHVNVSAELAAGLTEFVRAGGTVIADFPLGFKDDGGTVQRQVPGAGLADLFGAWANDAVPSEPDEDTLTVEGMPLEPGEFRQELYLLEGAEVLGHWRDGSAGMIRRRDGAGTTILAGTLFFWPPDDGRRESLLTGWLADAGVAPVAMVIPENGTTMEAAARVEVCPMEPLGEGERLVVVLNHNAEPVRVTVSLTGLPPAERPIDLLTDQPVPVTPVPDGVRFTLELAPKGTQAFLTGPRVAAETVIMGRQGAAG